jgi:hypothetical protein
MGWALSSLLVAFLVSCGRDGAAPSDGGAAFTTRVDPKKALGTLSTFEQMQLCKDIVQYTTSTLLPDVCRRAALTVTASAARSDDSLTDADLQSSCASAYSTCLASSLGTDSGVAGSDGGAMGGVGCDLSALHPTCSATVADYAACLTHLHDAVSSLPSCDATTRSLLVPLALDGGLNTARPPSCGPVDQCSSADGKQ